MMTATTPRATTATRARQEQPLRILHAIHDFLPRHTAGSEIYAFRLCRALAERGHEVHVLAAEFEPGTPHLTLRWSCVDGVPVTTLVNNWAFRSFTETYRSDELGRQLGHVLDATAPDVLHVHSLLNLSFELPALARTRGVASVATLHDYTLVCPSGGQRLHQAEDHVCHDIEPERCRRCFAASPMHEQLAFGRTGLARTGSQSLSRLLRAARSALPGLAARAVRTLAREPITESEIELRLAAARATFATIDLFVAPSPSLAAEFVRLGLPPERLRVSDYGFADLGGGANDLPVPRAACRPGDRLRIGFVGTLVAHKGPHVLLEAVRKLPAASFELLIFGSEATFPDYTARLRTLALGLPVRFLGGFAPDHAREVYAQFDVLVVPSLWLENSPLVIHEAFLAGRPVIGARIGGIADLVVDGVNGLLYEPRSADDLARALRSLLDHPPRVAELAAGRPAVKGIADDAREWEAIYAEVAHGARGTASPPTRPGPQESVKP